MFDYQSIFDTYIYRYIYTLLRRLYAYFIPLDGSGHVQTQYHSHTQHSG